MRLLVKYTTTLLLIFALLVASPPTTPIASEPSPVRAKHAIVASASGLASEVGMQIMKRGGNAVDAAVAVGLALTVTYPIAGNIGGGGFMLIRMSDGHTTAIDYRETAPTKAHKNMYLDKDGNLIPKASSVGHLSVAVPGTVAGFALALEKYGTMKWKDVVEPARQLAVDGFIVSYDLAKELRFYSYLLEQFPESRKTFLKNGKYYEEGELFRQPELAETFKRLQDHGPREFYEGQTAKLLVEEVLSKGGIITLDDLKNYSPIERQPLKGSYRDYQIITMPPPSSGGVALLEMLNILENYDLNSLGSNSAQKYHILIEAMKRAFADRAELLGDPDFVKVPVNDLISKRHASELAKAISQTRSTPSVDIKPSIKVIPESNETTHFSIIDQFGNVVSNTYTLNFAYGSGVTVPKAGFLLNNEMDDFAAKPGIPNTYNLIQGEANAVAAKKRPLSSMTPTIVLKDNKVWFATGSPGGPTIINVVLQVIIN
ncbi:MAG: gamma-glutamyltransferase, partial [Blastocatellia bacterium]|nr:gamma-glutamyltransferase [Blastocatellia bacterium]